MGYPPHSGPYATRSHGGNLDYLDFELSVDARGNGEYEVSVRAPSGEARTRVRFPFDPDALAAQLRAVEGALEQTRAVRDVLPVEANGATNGPRETVRQFGQTLFTTLLSGKVLVAWRTSGALAEKDGRGLRLQLRLQAPEMAALPWELMFDPDDASFVCLNPSTPLVRYPEIDRAAEHLTISLPLRVLGMVASPSDLPQLDKNAERGRIERALTRLQRDALVELTWIGGTYRDLQAALREGPWHVFHFIGHGGFEGDVSSGGAGVLAFETTPSMVIQSTQMVGAAAEFPGPAHMVSADLVGRLLRGHPSLRLVLLNSCLGARANTADVFSSTASTLIRRGVPAVIAMQNEITDRAAVTFAQAFYTSVAAGTAVDRAVTDARTAISAVNRESMEWGTPVLMMRSPDGRLFSQATARSGESSSAITITPRHGEAELVPGHRVRIRSAVFAAVAGVPIVAAAVLGRVTASGVALSLDAQVGGVSVVFPGARALGEPIEATSIGVAGVSSVTIPGTGTTEADRLLLTALDEPGRSGRLTLDLTPVLPAGTRITLTTGDEPGSYKLTMGDSIPNLALAASGPVKVVVPGAINERVDFPTPAVISLATQPGPVDIEFRPTAGSRTRLADRLPADGLDLTRVDRYESPTGTELREVSTIRSGRLTIDNGDPRPLDAGERLHGSGVRGELTRLELAGDHLELQVQGHAERLVSGSGVTERTLAPSLLTWLVRNHALWLGAGAALYAGAAALALFRTSRESV